MHRFRTGRTIRPSQAARLKGHPRRSVFGERAQSTTEFVAVFPLVLLLLFLIIDFAWLGKNYLVVTNTARESARCTVAGNCKQFGNDIGPTALAAFRLSRMGAPSADILSIRYIDLDDDNYPSKGDTIIVCVRGQNNYVTPLPSFFSWLTGGGLPNPLPLHAREEMIIDGNIPGSYASEMTQAASDVGCSFPGES
jgi:hypothetical protein